MALKKRYWTAVAYPGDSLPENWKDILTETHLPIAVSPVHDKDINESTGEPKKPHIHILFCFDGPTTRENVRQITDRLNCPMPVAVDSVRGAVRYLTHKDNPEKAQYDDKDILLFNGFDLASFCELTAGEVNKVLDELVTLIRERSITEYCDLIDYLQDQGDTDRQGVAMSHTYFLDNYIKSARNKAKNTLQGYRKALIQTSEEMLSLLHDAQGRVEAKELDQRARTLEEMLKEMPF